MVVVTSAREIDITRRYVGVVKDIKLVNSKYLIITDIRQYFVGSRDYIFVGDSLYEYWIDAQKCCIGVNNDVHLTVIIKKDE